MKILVTHPLNRKTFDIVNILLKYYSIDSLVFCYSGKEKNKVKTIYSPKYLFPLNCGESFNSELQIICEKFCVENIVYLPIEESSTIDFLRFINIFGEGNLKFLLPTLCDYQLSRNKAQLNVFCENNFIPCHNFITSEQFNTKNFSIPIIIKPIHGSGSKGIRMITSSDELTSVNIDFENEFLQELLPNGKNVEAGFYFCIDGEIQKFYSHKRIRTFPEKGGVSVFSEFQLNDTIKEAGAEIIKMLKWSGVLMIEFIFDEREKKYKLIEINPRFWGSILLSEFSGSDFIKSYVSLSTGEALTFSKPREKVFIRWLFPYDLLFYTSNLQNPFNFFKIKRNTCYINFTYSTPMKSILFMSLTYFSLNKILSIFKE